MHSSSKSTLFLMEILLAILFFVLGCSVCLQGFAKAHLLSQKSQNLLEANQQIKSIVACLQAEQGGTSLLEQQLPVVPAQGAWKDAYPDSQFLLFYDAQWQSSSAPQGAFVAVIAPSQEPRGQYQIHMVQTADSTTIMQQNIFVHPQNPWGGEVTP